jgi:hypothetical protein
MRISLTPRNTTALLALTFLMQETHKLAHTSVGRLVCGCWGPRNVNLWGLCRQCAAGEPLTLVATLAGPLYSFSVIWIGYYLLHRASARAKSVGFALVVSSMPFSRVLTPIFGGGDEIFGMTRLGVDHALAWGIALAFVFALAVPPVVGIYMLIENRRRVLWMVGLILVPFLLTGAVVFGGLQGLVLQNGVLRDSWIMGSPMIVTAWLFTTAGAFAIFGRHLPTLLKSTQ